jgi:hypothetical protein
MAKKAKKEILVVGSKVKAYIKSKKFMTAGDFTEALSEEVYALIDKAVARTKGNNRSTVKAKDL